MKCALSIAALVMMAGAAQGQVLINEVLGSTGGTDAEFIELVNTGAAPVDISGYQIELWDSDVADAGTPDAGSPYVVGGGTILAPGAVWTIANDVAFDLTFGTGYYQSPNPTTWMGQSFNADEQFAQNSIENSSYTIVLTDASGVPILDSWYFSDGGAGDFANRAGTPITAGIDVPLDGSFLAPGFARTDYLGNGVLLPFSTPGFGPPELNDGTLAGGTPGINQVPAPGALALAGLGGLVGIRRRR